MCELVCRGRPQVGPADTRPHQPKYVPDRVVPTIEFPDKDSAEDGVSDPFGNRDYFPPPDIVGLLEDEGATTLLSLLEQADLLALLEKKKGSYTLFAPTNEAFAALDRRVIQQLADDVELLESVLK